MADVILWHPMNGIGSPCLARFSEGRRFEGDQALRRKSHSHSIKDIINNNGMAKRFMSMSANDAAERFCFASSHTNEETQ